MNDLFELSHRHLLSAVARMAEEEDKTTLTTTPSRDEDALSSDGVSGQDWAYVLYPRITGTITVISSLCMIIMAWRRRKFLFHRLIFGMAIHQIIYGMAYIVGIAAIPGELSGYFGNFGTWGTCTVQGLLQYVCTRVAMIYYACFSIYSYVGVMCGFDRHQYLWCEKWIHAFAHAYPVIMGVYLLFTEGFNPGHGFCQMASYPYSCELSEDVACERGADDYGEIQIIMLWLLPLIVFIVFPTAIMSVLYYKVRGFEMNEESGKVCVIQSQTIAMQSGVYLSILYWTMFPFFISGGVRYYSEIDPDKLFPYVLVAQINLSLFGLWSMLAYRHFSIDPYARSSGKLKAIKSDHLRTRNTGEDESSIPSAKDKAESTNGRCDAAEYIFNTGERSSSSLAENSMESDAPTAKTDKRKSGGEEDPEPKGQRRYSFNIFDGTNASGAFAVFVHEGDSEDERMEKEETERWASIQNHI